MWILRRLSCVLAGGHLFVSRRGAGRLQERCYVCDTPRGAGWSFRVPRRLRVAKRRPVARRAPQPVPLRRAR
ncbi:MAG TPA: hypothetical protein VM364_07935 [Vicinamibacterales bacterium]|nr:hypothetical protein [Vicinamibacterales bacterium]